MAGRYPPSPFLTFLDLLLSWRSLFSLAVNSVVRDTHTFEGYFPRTKIYLFLYFFFCHSSVILFDCLQGWQLSSLRKHPTFGEASTGFPANWRLRNVCRNSKPLLIGRGREISFNQSGALRDASSVWNFCANFSGVISRQTSCGVTKCQLFSRANKNPRWAL